MSDIKYLLWSSDFEIRVDGVSVTNKLDGTSDIDIVTYTGVTLKKFNSSISVSFATGEYQNNFENLVSLSEKQI